MTGAARRIAPPPPPPPAPHPGSTATPPSARIAPLTEMPTELAIRMAPPPAPPPLPHDVVFATVIPAPPEPPTSGTRNVLPLKPPARSGPACPPAGPLPACAGDVELPPIPPPNPPGPGVDGTRAPGMVVTGCPAPPLRSRVPSIVTAPLANQ